jgi:hypothetical protein
MEGARLAFRPRVDIARTKDLSEKGLAFTASSLLPPRIILDIKLQLPLEKESVDLEGRVVDCEEIKKDFIYGVRVEFVSVEEERRDLLKRFVQLFLKSNQNLGSG